MFIDTVVPKYMVSDIIDNQEEEGSVTEMVIRGEVLHSLLSCCSFRTWIVKRFTADRTSNYYDTYINTKYLC